MNTNTSSAQSSKSSSLTAAIIRRLLQLVVFILIQAAILFGAAGRLSWRAAWAFWPWPGWTCALGGCRKSPGRSSGPGWESWW